MKVVFLNSQVFEHSVAFQRLAPQHFERLARRRGGDVEKGRSTGIFQGTVWRGDRLTVPHSHGSGICTVLMSVLGSVAFHNAISAAYNNTERIECRVSLRYE